MGSILDNPSALINYKNRNGLNIKHNNSASVYILEKQMKKIVNNLLSSRITEKMELAITTDKVIEKCYSLPHLLALKRMLEELGEEVFTDNLMLGIKKFMKELKPYLLEEQKSELKKQKELKDLDDE